MNWRALRSPAFVTALLVLCACAIGMGAAIRAYGVYLRKLAIYAPGGRLLNALPTETAGWTRVGQDEFIKDEDTLAVLGTSNYVTRSYQRRSEPGGVPGPVLVFHAAYYTNQIDTVPHVPERCWTGAGMTLVGGPWLVGIPLGASSWRPHPDATGEEIGRVFTVPLSNRYSDAGGRRIRLPRGLTPGEPLRLRVTAYSAPGGQTLYGGYFFIANGGWAPSANEVRLLAFDLRADYAYYLKVQVSSADVGSPEELASLAGSLLDDLLGELMRCVPDWVEVEAGRYPADNPKRARPSAVPARTN
jgi:hypothetical protein